MGIGARINLGFTFTIALMMALTGVGLTHIHLADARLKNIVEKNNVKTEMAQIMQSALRERALNMHIIAVSDDPFLKDECISASMQWAGSTRVPVNRSSGWQVFRKKSAYSTKSSV